MKLLKSFVLLALLPLSAFAGDVFFQSPSGNIYCEGYDNSVGCFIFQTNQGDHDYTYIIDANAKYARKVYGADGGNIFDEPIRTIAYGKSIYGNGWLCTSKKSGMTCKNKYGHGFSLSRSVQRVF